MQGNAFLPCPLQTKIYDILRNSILVDELVHHISCRYFTCSKTMPGSLGHEEQDAKSFASWVKN